MNIESHPPARLVGAVDVHVRVARGTLYRGAAAHLAHFALLLMPLEWDRADSLHHLHRLWIGKLDLWRPHRADDVRPIIPGRPLERLARMIRLVLVGIFNLPPINLRRLLVRLILGSFLLVRRLVVGIVLFGLGVWVLVLGAEHTVVSL